MIKKMVVDDAQREQRGYRKIPQGHPKREIGGQAGTGLYRLSVQIEADICKY